MTRDISTVINKIKKLHGEESIRLASEIKVRVFPTQLPTLDYALGGGLLWGRLHSLAGRKGSGKTSICYSTISRFQKIGGVVFYIDLERQFDPKRAELFGVNPNELYVLSGDFSSEQLFKKGRDIIKATKEANLKTLLVIDSLTAAGSEKLFEEVVTETYAGGGTAAVNNQAVRVWNTLLGDNQIIVIVNQLRDNLGMGEEDQMSGGRAQEFTSSQIIWTREGETIKDGGSVVIGTMINFTVKKSRSSNPKARYTMPYYFASGFDIVTSLIDVALAEGILEKTVGWYKLPDGILYNDSNKVQGKDSLVNALKDNREFLNKLADVVYKKICNYPIWDGG